MPDERREKFLKRHAKKEFICRQFAETLRELVRAIGATTDAQAAICRASEQMAYVDELLSWTDDPVTYYELISSAVAELRAVEPRHASEREVLGAARRGMLLIAELTCTDNAAPARVAQREEAFLSAVKRTVETRDGETTEG